MAASAAPPWLLDADLAAPKYNEAVAVAAEKCGEDTKGQTCYICTQALHWKTKEGLVRGRSCRGTAGFVHVSCLAEQAKILVAEVELRDGALPEPRCHARPSPRSRNNVRGDRTDRAARARRRAPAHKTDGE